MTEPVARRARAARLARDREVELALRGLLKAAALGVSGRADYERGLGRS